MLFRSGDSGSGWEVCSGDVALNSTKHYLMPRKTRNGTHKRRLRDGDESGWGSDGSSEHDRFRFRECLDASSSPSSESVEYVSEGVTDVLRDGGDGCGEISEVPGDGGV